MFHKIRQLDSKSYQYLFDTQQSAGYRSDVYSRVAICVFSLFSKRRVTLLMDRDYRVKTNRRNGMSRDVRMISTLCLEQAKDIDPM